MTRYPGDVVGRKGGTRAGGSNIWYAYATYMRFDDVCLHFVLDVEGGVALGRD